MPCLFKIYCWRVLMPFMCSVFYYFSFLCYIFSWISCMYFVPYVSIIVNDLLISIKKGFDSNISKTTLFLVKPNLQPFQIPYCCKILICSRNDFHRDLIIFNLDFTPVVLFCWWVCGNSCCWPADWVALRNKLSRITNRGQIEVLNCNLN